MKEMEAKKLGLREVNTSYVVPKLNIDKFSGKKLLTIHYEVNGTEYFIHTSSNQTIFLYFSFRNYDGEDYIVFRVEKSEYKLRQGDTISLLFEPNIVQEFLIERKPYKPSGTSKDLETSCPLTVAEIDIFTNKIFLKWKIKSKKDNVEFTGGINENFAEDTEHTQKEIIDYAIAYKSFIDEYIDNHKPILQRPGYQEEKTTSINNRTKIPQDIMDAVWRRDEGKCVECGNNEKLEFDHIIPISKGGANSYRNLQLLCENCNRKKSNKIG